LDRLDAIARGVDAALSALDARRETRDRACPRTQVLRRKERIRIVGRRIDALAGRKQRLRGGCA
jgi:hypothetical protein